MKSLIEKAIKAIEDQKYERAVGLLEGVLEMSGEKSGLKDAGFYSVSTPLPINTGGAGSSTGGPRPLDPSQISDAEIKARLANVQKVSHLETQ